MPPQNSVNANSQSARTAAIIAYILFGAALVTGGILGLVGAIVAYVKRGQGGPVWDSHFSKLIQLFWITVATFIVFIVLGLSILGAVVVIPLGLIYLIWYIYRVVKGLLRAIDGRAYSG